jgi:hypothetical protein
MEKENKKVMVKVKIIPFNKKLNLELTLLLKVHKFYKDHKIVHKFRIRQVNIIYKQHQKATNQI